MSNDKHEQSLTPQNLKGQNLLDQQAIQKIAALAQLKLTEAEALELGDQLTKVISYFDKISVIDTTNIEPLITPTEIDSYLREDQVSQILSSDEIVANAPDKQGHLFKVPPVV